MEYLEEAIFMSVDIVQVEDPHHHIQRLLQNQTIKQACSVSVTFAKCHMLN